METEHRPEWPKCCGIQVYDKLGESEKDNILIKSPVKIKCV